MKIRTWNIVIGFALFTQWAIAAGQPQIVALPESRIRLDGDSTLRKFSSDSTQFSIQARIDPPTSALTSKSLDRISDFTLRIPVKTLKSDDSTLDEHMYEALKADQHPEILIRIKSHQLIGKGSNGSAVQAAADMTVAGVTKLVYLTASAAIDGDHVRIKGEKDLLMSDFGIEPPSLMLGLIKTANEITIRYDVVLGLRDLNPSQGKSP
jgi:polyisoprenoid-binding protein YceI